MPLKVGRTLSDKQSKYLSYSQKLYKVLKISFEINKCPLENIIFP